MNTVRIILIIALIFSAFLVLISCHTTKKIESSTTKKDLNEIIDSATKHIRDSMNESILIKEQEHQKEIETIKKTGVKFVTNPCPNVKIDSSCNKDSLVKIIRMQEIIINQQNRKIRINTDGSIEAEGDLEEAYSNLDTKEKEVDRLKLDSINRTRISDSLSNELKKAINEKTSAEKKNKNVERTSGGFFTWWWLIIIGFAGGYVFANRKTFFSK